MTNLPNFNREAFHAAAQLWRDAGWEVVNPVDIDASDHKPKYIYMRQDIRELVTCDAIANLPGWRDSDGARSENIVASICEIPVFDAMHPASYETHAFEANVCCMKPDYVHEQSWGRSS